MAESNNRSTKLDSKESSPDSEFPREIRLVLVGKTGIGKSVLGNSLLRKILFSTDVSPTSFTDCCVSHNNNIIISEKNVRVKIIDTPGLFDTAKPNNETLPKLLNCIIKSEPGVHVFLLVISLQSRFGAEERQSIDLFEGNFGSETEQHTMIVFTFKNALGQKTLKQWIGESEFISQLVKKYKNRYVSIDNSGSDVMKNLDVDEIYKMIHKIIRDNHFKYYDKGLFQTAQAWYKQKQEEDQRLEKEEWKVKLREEFDVNSEIEKGMAEKTQQFEEEKKQLLKDNERQLKEIEDLKILLHPEEKIKNLEEQNKALIEKLGNFQKEKEKGLADERRQFEKQLKD